MSLYETGIRPKIDEYIRSLSEERRDYGKYWQASSAGYCARRNIFERLNVPYVTEDARKQRVFEAGHIFHQWLQGVTKNAGLSLAQELELVDNELMVKGHIDDLVLVTTTDTNLILYDYKTQNSRAFSYQKGRPMSHYHKMQLGTYLYMLRKKSGDIAGQRGVSFPGVKEGRVLKISKDDLRMSEQQLIWGPELKREVLGYWAALNESWRAYAASLDEDDLPPCTCGDHEGGFLAKEAYNPFFFDGQPCSVEWFKRHKEGAVTHIPA